MGSLVLFCDKWQLFKNLVQSSQKLEKISGDGE